jgi:hypothetical protein
MSLIFPSNPTLNQTYQSGSSSTYKWNGTFWSISAPAQTGLTVYTASYAERVVWMQQTPPPTGTGSLWYDQDTGNMYVKYDAAWVPAQSTIGNAVTASFATSASFATTASYLSGRQAEYLLVKKSTSQTFILGYNNITNFDIPVANTLVTSSWNGTTGVFTAGRTATYRVGGSFIVNLVADAIGDLYSLSVLKNGTQEAEQIHTVYATNSLFKSIIIIPTIISVVAGDTITFQWYQSINANRNNIAIAKQNYITIEELPTRIS